MQVQIADVFDHAGFGGILKRAVLDEDIVDLRILQTDKIERPTALFGRDILQMNVAYRGKMLAAILVVLKIDSDHGLFNLADANSSDK